MAPFAAFRADRAAGRCGLFRLLGCGGLLLGTGLGLAAARAGEIQATGGVLGLGSQVNGVVGGSCSSGSCAISGGTAAGSNLFHRFSGFDTRGGISGVSIDGQGFRNVVLGVISPQGTVLDKPLSLSGGGNLIWLSPGGIQLSGGYGFSGMAQLSLSTATGLRVGDGLFDVLRTTASQAGGLSGTPLLAPAGLLSDPASLQGIGLSHNGDLSIAGGLLTVDNSLLLDAQGGNVLLQGAQIQAPAIAVRGQAVVQSAALSAAGSEGGSVRIEAAANLLASAPINASGSNGSGGSITLRAGGALIQTAGSRLEASGSSRGGSITVSGGSSLFSSGSYAAGGLGGTASGGAIELTAPSLVLRSAQADASGGGGGGAVRIGGGWQGAALSQGGSPALSVDIDAGSSLRADASQAGNGGLVVVWSEGSSRFAGVASARGGDGGGDGGAIEVSGKGVLRFAGQADAAAPAGQAGQLLLDPETIIISSNAPSSGTAYSTTTLWNPTGTLSSEQAFAQDVLVLNNGNIIASDPDSDLVASKSGAVYQFNASGALVSLLFGTSANDMVGSGGLTALSNGNYVVSSPDWSVPGGTAQVGAITWRNGSATSAGSVISSEAVGAGNSLIGSNKGDLAQAEVTPLFNNIKGNFVVTSPSWTYAFSDASGATISRPNAGAIIVGDGTIGSYGPSVNKSYGPISASNALIGTSTNDALGSGGVTALNNGNAVVSSPLWNRIDGSGNVLASLAGAATFVDGLNAGTGSLNDLNSLVGNYAGDQLSSGGIQALSNGNYVVASPSWNLSGVVGELLVPQVGAASWGDGIAGSVGVVSASNALIGSSKNDQVSSGGITALPDGNYVVVSPEWNLSDASGGVLTPQVGAVTWADGSSGASGRVVDVSNSLIGSTAGDRVGSGGVTTLESANGDYVVSSPAWSRGPGISNVGAATWRDGSGNSSGVVGFGNSLIGAGAGDRVSSGGITALSTGHYVVASPEWNLRDSSEIVIAAAAGAATWRDGSGNASGVVGPGNSLVGSGAGDRVSSGGVTALTNGNYVVASPDWNLRDGSGTVLAAAAGAATWVDGSNSLPTGPVGSGNSWLGSSAGDQVASGGITALGNGDFVVASPNWNRRDSSGTVIVAPQAGAATWGNGSIGSAGFVGDGNSLIGSSAQDQVASGGVTDLGSGHFVVSSPLWNLKDSSGNTIAAAGAATFGFQGLVGSVASSNSITGRSAGDRYSDGDGAPSVLAFPFGGSSSFLTNSVFYNRPNPASPGSTVTGSGLLQLVSAFPFSPADPLLPIDTGTISAGDYKGQTITISPTAIAAIAANGTPVTLQATADIRLLAGSDITITPISIGAAGDLTFQAGRSIVLDSNIFSTGSAVNLLVNAVADPQALTLSGFTGIALNPNTAIKAGAGRIVLQSGASPTNQAGPLTLTGASLEGSSITLTGDNGVAITAGSVLAATGDIAITGTAQPAAQSIGIDIQNSSLDSSSGGISLLGTAGDTTDQQGSSIGVRVDGLTMTAVTGLLIDGSAGDAVPLGTATAGEASLIGVGIYGSDLILLADPSPNPDNPPGITISGFGGGLATSASTVSPTITSAGIQIADQSTILSQASGTAGSGTISLEGDGGSVSSTANDASGSLFTGIQLAGGSFIGSDSGSITLTATGGNAQNGRVDALQILPNTADNPTGIGTTNGGSISINATAGDSLAGEGIGASIGAGQGVSNAVSLSTVQGGSINIASPSALTISGGSISSGPGGTITLASSSSDPLSSVTISNAVLNAGNPSGNGGVIWVDGVGIGISGSQLITSGSTTGGIINIGMKTVPPPETIEIVATNLQADPPGTGGQININARRIYVNGNELNLLGDQGGSIAVGSSNTNYLELTNSTLITLSRTASSSFQVGPGGTLINNARFLVLPAEPPGPVIPPVNPPPPGGNKTTEPPIKVPGELGPSINQPPLNTNPNTSTQIQPVPDPLFGRNGIDASPGGRVVLTSSLDASSIGNDAGTSSDSDAQGELRATVTSLNPDSARSDFEAGNLQAQQDTARKLGLQDQEQTTPPTMEQLQAFLKRITQWMRSKSSGSGQNTSAPRLNDQPGQGQRNQGQRSQGQ